MTSVSREMRFDMGSNTQNSNEEASARLIRRLNLPEERISGMSRKISKQNKTKKQNWSRMSKWRGH
ncbi:rCG20427, partial [Rattus norvegicus]